MTGAGEVGPGLWRGGEMIDAEAILESYHPQSQTIAAAVWEQIRPEVLVYVRNTLPCSAGSAQNRARITGQFMQWCIEMGYGTAARDIFTEDLVEAFFATGIVPARGVAGFRSQLRRVARTNNRHAVWTPTPEVQKHVSLRPPYSADEIAGYLGIVKSQRTARRRRTLAVTLHVGLGLGLTSSEILQLRREDLELRGSLLVANVNGRVVPARARYSKKLWRLAQETEGSRLLGDHLRPKRSFENLIRELDVPPYLPPLRVRRLRTTWLFELLAAGNLTLPEFRAVSGIGSGRVLDDLMPYLPIRCDYLDRASES